MTALVGGPSTTTQRVIRRTGQRCRLCDAPLEHVFLDLGSSPLCESFLSEHQLDQMEPFFPLAVYLCHGCLLAQLPAYTGPDTIFEEYAYFSSYSDSWVDHARRYVDAMCRRLGLGPESFVVEVASNDGYLLQHLKERKIPILGIEPARNVGAVAVQRGIPTVFEFLGERSGQAVAQRYGQADLVVANNVVAHVPDLHDFISGLAALLKPTGTLTLEFPHLLRLIESNQFDTVYHEHFSYFSLHTLGRALRAHGLEVVDVEELPTHGGSLRVFATHQAAAVVKGTVRELEARERLVGLLEPTHYDAFDERVQATRRSILRFLLDAKESGKSVVGYGAPGKGNTLLNYCGVRSDLISFTVDRNPYKHGKYLPGTHIPVRDVQAIAEARPDYLFILPWNIKHEIMAQMDWVKAWNCRFVVPIPQLEVI